MPNLPRTSWSGSPAILDLTALIVSFSCASRAVYAGRKTSAFRSVAPGTYEVDAHFGSTGEHLLHLVTAPDLGVSLIAYCRKVIERNRIRKQQLTAILAHDHALLREGDWPGIPMAV
jgi:hypothetical protein